MVGGVITVLKTEAIDETPIESWRRVERRESSEDEKRGI